jgi:cyclophilin family peptidyl-prolyl cis-trans isomerase
LTFQTPGAAPINRDFEVAAASTLRPRVRLETTLGDFTIELEGEAAPLHTANFLLYLDDGFYDGLLIHRVVCRDAADSEECEPFVIQGGGFLRDGDEIVPLEPTRDPIQSEADNGLSNGELYSVALALTGGNANSGTTQFFVNLDQDNESLDAQNFTVFGRVVIGQEVVDQIARAETIASPIIPREQSLPVDDIVIVRAVRD